MLINDRLRPILPTVGAFRRRSMQVKWLSCKALKLLATNRNARLQTANSSQFIQYLLASNTKYKRGCPR